MSKFFKALEQAEQEQALRRPTAPSARPSERGPAVREMSRDQALRSVPEAPRDVAGELDEHLVSLLDPASFEAEQYRTLRHLIEQLRKSTELSVVAVSSPTAADGKTTTAINLAGALAQGSAARILLVDADLRGAGFATYLALGDHTGPGLVDAILDEKLTLEAVAQPHPHLNLSVLPAGRSSSSPYEVLKSPRVGELLTEGRRRYDYIVLDTPPMVSFPDCRVIEKWVDGFLIVVGAHRTARRLLEEALNVTERGKIVGLVFNGDDRHLSRNYHASGRYVSGDGRGGRRRLLWGPHSTSRK